MKTKNFPERKNKRRKGALSRLDATKPGRKSGKIDAKELEEVTLASRIINDARHVRTKIRRGDGRHIH